MTKLHEAERFGSHFNAYPNDRLGMSELLIYIYSKTDAAQNHASVADDLHLMTTHSSAILTLAHNHGGRTGVDWSLCGMS